MRVLLSACGVVLTLAFAALGEDRCAPCHDEIVRTWQMSAHGRAGERLSVKETRDERCAACHLRSWTEPRKENPHGIGCAPCHGAGWQHIENRERRGPGVRAHDGLKPRASVARCKSCHQQLSPHLLPRSLTLPADFEEIHPQSSSR
ncbi:MAG: multiheme c-type cytochrome [Myxococcota bacterium]|nr:multiheme c-type cytochrome [Myxococcota bacterium]